MRRGIWKSGRSTGSDGSIAGLEAPVGGLHIDDRRVDSGEEVGLHGYARDVWCL